MSRVNEGRLQENEGKSRVSEGGVIAISGYVYFKIIIFFYYEIESNRKMVI